MLRHILPLIPEHDLYCEPFVGGGAVYWAKEPARLSAINDLNAHVNTFYRVLKYDYAALVAMVEATPHSEAEYYVAKAILTEPDDIKDIDRAWAFWVCTQMSFSCKLFGGWAHARRADSQTQPQSTVTRKLRLSSAEVERLESTEIWSREALDVIERKDCPHAFHYVDPPYVSSCQGHYAGYTRADWERLLEVLAKAQGKWMLSSYDESGLAEWTEAHGFHRVTVEQSQSVSHGNKGRKVEVLTMNYRVAS